MVPITPRGQRWRWNIGEGPTRRRDYREERERDDDLEGLLDEDAPDDGGPGDDVLGGQIGRAHV